MWGCSAAGVATRRVYIHCRPATLLTSLRSCDRCPIRLETEEELTSLENLDVSCLTRVQLETVLSYGGGSLLQSAAPHASWGRRDPRTDYCTGLSNLKAAVEKIRAKTSLHIRPTISARTSGHGFFCIMEIGQDAPSCG